MWREGWVGDGVDRRAKPTTYHTLATTSATIHQPIVHYYSYGGKSTTYHTLATSATIHQMVFKLLFITYHSHTQASCY